MAQKLTLEKERGARQVLHKAIQAFPGTQNVQLTEEPADAKAQSGSDTAVSLNCGSHTQTYHACIKIKYENAHLYQLCHLATRVADSQQLLLVTSELSAGQAEALKHRGIQFIDTAGNAYVDAGGVYVFVSGKRCSTAIPRPKGVSRLLQPRGLQVVFTCLTAALRTPDASRTHPVMRLETLARLAGVSLGTASEIRRNLIEQGYLMITRETCRWSRLPELFERWAAAYAERLYPKLVIRRYRSVMPTLDVETPLPENALWGGETAASRLTHYITPQVNTIYIAGEPGGFATRFGLIADPAGNVELRNMFWSPELPTQQYCVSPILVYADLLASDHPRNIETAELIHERFIADHLQAVDSRAS